MFKTFNELWESAENLHKESKSDSSIIDELLMKINLYKLTDKSGIDSEELKKAKSRLFGEILLTLTNLSLVDNVNVFEALLTAYQYRSIGIFDKKYQKS